MNLVQLLAQATAPTTQGSPPPSAFLFLQQFGPILLLGLAFYFLMMRSKGNERKQREQMLSALKRGDRVQTIGGILGTVVEARENDVLLKVDESTNTKMRFARSAIHKVLEEEKAAGK